LSWSLAANQLRPESNKVWGVMQQRLYECHMNSVDELKQHFVEVWISLQQNVVDAAINEWRKWLRECVRADGQHFEHILRVRVTDKNYERIKYR